MQPFIVDHLFQLEQLGRYFGGPFCFAPDGSTLAFTLQRAKNTTQRHQYPFLWGNDRADIWLVDLPTGQPVRITHGAAEDAGYWAPLWSPDGQRLAMLSTHGGGVTVWIWEKATGTLRQLTSASLAFENILDCPYGWLTSETLLCALLPEAEKPKFMTVVF